MKRWPHVTSPDSSPSIANGTISAVSCSVASVHTIPRNGRTQRNASGFAEAAPQRIDFGHGNERMIAGHDLGDGVFRLAARLLDHSDIELALLRVGLDPRVLDAARGLRF